MEIKNNNIIPLSEQQLKLIESFGVFGNENGLLPSATRIFALLLVADKVELTFDEIRETLGFSKSATSTAIKLLLSNKKIEYITKTGDRKRYFRSKIETWKDTLADGFNYLTTYHKLLNEILEVRSEKTVEFNKAIKELSSFLEFTEEELSRIYEKWESTKGNTK